MAWKIVFQVLDMPITKDFTSELKFTAIVYANFANSNGDDAFPSVATVARITGYHERSIQRYQRRLVKLGVLIPDGRGRMGTNKYKVASIERGGTQSPPKK